MRHFLSCLLLACAGPANTQPQPPQPLPFEVQDLDVVQGGTAWLVGDHVAARHHFQAAARRGHPLGQFNLAMMLLYREGGDCDAVQAIALLGKSADAGIHLAHEALAQMPARQTARQGRKSPFPCALPRQAPATTVVSPVQPAVAR